MEDSKSSSNASWFLAFLSGQIKPSYINDNVIFNQLKNIPFEIDDIDDLMSKKTIRDTYKDQDGKFDEKAFKKEYNKTLDLFTEFELKKVNNNFYNNIYPFIDSTIEDDSDKKSNITNSNIEEFQKGGKIDSSHTQSEVDKYGSYRITTDPEKSKDTGERVNNTYINNNFKPYQVDNFNYEDYYTPDELGQQFNNKSIDSKGNKIDKLDSGFWNPLLVVKDKEGKYITLNPKDSEGNTININESIAKGFLDINKNATKENNEMQVVSKLGLFGAQQMHKDMSITNFAKQALAAGTTDLLFGVIGGASDVLRNINLDIINDIDNIVDSGGSKLSADSSKGKTFDSRWWYDAMSQGTGQLLGIFATGGISAGLGASGATIGKITNYSFSLYGMNAIGDELRKAGYDNNEVLAGQLASLALLTKTNKAAEWVTKGLTLNESKLLLEDAIKSNTSAITNKFSKETAYLGIKDSIEKINKTFSNNISKILNSDRIKKSWNNGILNAAKEELTQETLEGIVPQFVFLSQEALNKLVSNSNDINVNNKYLDNKQNYLKNIWDSVKSSLPEGIAGAATGGGVKALTSGFDKKSNTNQDVKYIDYLTNNGTNFDKDDITNRYNEFVREANKLKDNNGFFSSNLAITKDYKLVPLSNKDKKDNNILDVNSAIHNTVIRDITNSYNYFNFIFDDKSKDIGYQNIQKQFNEFADKNNISNKDFNSYKLDFIKNKLVSDANNQALADVLFFSNNTEFTPKDNKGKSKKSVSHSQGLLSLVHLKEKITGTLEGTLNPNSFKDVNGNALLGEDLINALKERNNQALTDSDFSENTTEQDKNKTKKGIASLIGGEFTEKVKKENELTSEESNRKKELLRKSNRGRIPLNEYKELVSLKKKSKQTSLEDNIIKIKSESSIDSKIEKQKELLSDILEGKYNHELLAKINFQLQIDPNSQGKSIANWDKPSSYFGTNVNNWKNFLNLNETSTESIEEAKLENYKEADKQLHNLSKKLNIEEKEEGQQEENTSKIPTREDIPNLESNIDQSILKNQNEKIRLNELYNNSEDETERNDITEGLSSLNEEEINLNNIKKELNSVKDYYTTIDKPIINSAYFNRVIFNNKNKSNYSVNSSSKSIIEKINDLLFQAYKIPSNITLDNLEEELNAYRKLNGERLDKNWSDDTIADVIYEMQIRKSQVALNAGANVKSIQYNSIFKPILDELSKLSEFDNWKNKIIPIAENIKIDNINEYNPLNLHTLSQEEANTITKKLDSIITELQLLKQESDNNSPSFEEIRIKADIEETSKDLENTISILNSINLNNNIIPIDDKDNLVNQLKVDFNLNINIDNSNLSNEEKDIQLTNIHINLNKIYQLLYNHYLKLSDIEKRSLLDNLIFNNSSLEEDIERTKLIKNSYIGIIGVSQSKYQESINHINKLNNIIKVPSYVQAKYIRLFVGALNSDMLPYNNEEKYINNSIWIKGIQGSGKTDIVLSQVASLFSYINKDKNTNNFDKTQDQFNNRLNDNIYVLSLSTELTEELSKKIENGTSFIKDDNQVLLPESINNSSYYDIVIDQIKKEVKDKQILDISSAYSNKTLIIDEATLLTDQNLQDLKELQNNINLKLIFAGDIKQIGTGEGLNGKIDFIKALEYVKQEMIINPNKDVNIDLDNFTSYKNSFNSFEIGELNSSRRTGNKAITAFIDFFRDGVNKKGFPTQSDIGFITKFNKNENGFLSGVETINTEIDSLGDEEWFLTIEKTIEQIKKLKKGKALDKNDLLILVSSPIQLEKYLNRFSGSEISFNIMLDSKAQGRKSEFVITDVIYPNLLEEDNKFKEFVDQVDIIAKTNSSTFPLEYNGFGSTESINYKLRKALVSTVGRAIKYALVRTNTQLIKSKQEKVTNYTIETKPNKSRLESYIKENSIDLVESETINKSTNSQNTISILNSESPNKESLWKPFKMDENKIKQSLLDFNLTQEDFKEGQYTPIDFNEGGIFLGENNNNADINDIHYFKKGIIDSSQNDDNSNFSGYIITGKGVLYIGEIYKEGTWEEYIDFIPSINLEENEEVITIPTFVNQINKETNNIVLIINDTNGKPIKEFNIDLQKDYSDIERLIESNCLF